ncbi:hypothetical protein TNIN_165531 [Trichonephila inaurata madagascariensis]|uniref:Uncharacterized protein n=1 Tax=Trichonephila inaurata madagascariensis TaxID=2747483 RepID=A0A8X7CIS6_9ARAC|nr:hypothetical protein TNIN_165531 [Trichonephila inaurata madagascariensis]
MQDQGTSPVQRKKILGAQTLQQEESKVQTAVYTPESSGAEEWTIKPSESKTGQRIQTAGTPGGRKSNQQKDCVAGSPRWRSER